MRKKPLFEEVVLVAEARAAAIHTASGSRFSTVLEKGRKFEAVVGLRDERDHTAFHDAQGGVTYICPRGTVFVLSGRFRKSAGFEPMA
jgi:hypothetical protein